MAPRLTIAIPLHRAGRWVENVCGVIEKAPEWSEVVLSDTTHSDDALERLEEKLGDDPRVVFRRREERLDWREHCNLLLEESEAEFFCWMPQDDAVGPDGYFDLLVAALDADEDAVLAFAPVAFGVRRGRGNPLNARRNIYVDILRKSVPRGEVKMIEVTPAITLGEQPPEDDALWMLENWVIALAWRGVFRRDIARPIPTAGDQRHTDSPWTFSIALAGHFTLVEDARYFKRYYRESAHQGFGLWSSSDQSALFRTEVEARLGEGSDRSERVLRELAGFYRRNESQQSRRALRRVTGWLTDQPRIAVGRY